MSTAARVKTWIAEILTHTDLNAEFDAMVTAINTKYDTANMVSTNTASKGVLRDASGNFAAGTITASLTGTASLATLATTATELSGATGGAWVSVASGNIELSGTGTANVGLRNGGAHNLYMYSVYTTSGRVAHGTSDDTASSAPHYAYIRQGIDSSTKDQLVIQQSGAPALTFYYKVYVWE